jgi:hypothetical protein
MIHCSPLPALGSLASWILTLPPNRSITTSALGQPSSLPSLEHILDEAAKAGHASIYLSYDDDFFIIS